MQRYLRNRKQPSCEKNKTYIFSQRYAAPYRIVRIGLTAILEYKAASIKWIHTK